MHIAILLFDVAKIPSNIIKQETNPECHFINYHLLSITLLELKSHRLVVGFSKYRLDNPRFLSLKVGILSFQRWRSAVKMVMIIDGLYSYCLNLRRLCGSAQEQQFRKIISPYWDDHCVVPWEKALSSKRGMIVNSAVWSSSHTVVSSDDIRIVISGALEIYLISYCNPFFDLYD